MISTLMDGRGNRTQVSPDHAATQDDSYNHDLERAATAILGAIERKSVPDLMQAFKDCFQACESQPHEEVEHETEES